MDTKTKIALWCVRGLGLVSIAMLALFFSGAFPQWFTGRGDLFRLTSVKQYEEVVDKPYHPDESVHTAPLDSGIVWWLGDSFSRVQFGHKPLPEAVSDKLTEAGVGKVAAVDYIDLQGSPKSLFALAAARAKEGKPAPKVIVVECVERNVYVNFGANAVFDYGDVAPWNEGKGLGSKVKRIRRRAFLEAPGTVDFKLRRFPPVAEIRELTDTWRYALYRDRHPDAKVWRRPMIKAYDGTIQPLPAMAKVADHLLYSPDSVVVGVGPDFAPENAALMKNLRQLDSLAWTFGARLLFVMPPNRNSQWVDGFIIRYDGFFDRFLLNGIQFVNLEDHFSKIRRRNLNGVPEEIFWRTDSHWNGKAHAAASEAIAEKLIRMIKKPEPFLPDDHRRLRVVPRGFRKYTESVPPPLEIK